MLDFILAAFAATLLLPVLFFLLQILSAIFLAKLTVSSENQQVRPTVAVLIPAHNESLVITETIQSVMPQLIAGDQLLVVADNCSDETARIAKKIGVNVIERSHETKRSKGYALDFGLQYLREIPPKIVVIIDADCIV